MEISVGEEDLVEAIEIAYSGVNPSNSSAVNHHNFKSDSKNQRRVLGLNGSKNTKAPAQATNFMPMPKVKFKFRKTKFNLKRTRLAASKAFPKQDVTPLMPCTNVED